MWGRAGELAKVVVVALWASLCELGRQPCAQKERGDPERGARELLDERARIYFWNSPLDWLRRPKLNSTQLD